MPPNFSQIFSSHSNTVITTSPQHSPPSLIYSDFSEDSEQDIMDPINHGEDASNVLQKVLGHLEGVVEHLRDKNENDAANSIAKNTVSIVEVFNSVTAPWDMEAFIMRRPVRCQNPMSNKPAPRNVSQRNGGSSWASIAAAPVEGRNSLIKFRPSDGIVKKYVEAEQFKEDGTDSRVVWILGWEHSTPLSTVTERVNHGPLLSMAKSEAHGAVCLIFQYAESARALLLQDSFHVQQKGYSIFGRGCSLVAGEAYPEDDDIRRMSQPINERRRLTFARSQLFAHGMNEDIFKQDIYRLVGQGNVELVWLFNTGNATVVFTSTTIARLVRDEFRHKARFGGPYQNIHVSFSHDPCEKPMNLITQMPCQGDIPHRNGSNKSLTNGTGLTRRESKRKQGVDADGWQTVQGRKR